MAVGFWQLPAYIWVAIEAPSAILHLLSDRIVLGQLAPTDSSLRIVPLRWRNDAFDAYYAAYWQPHFTDEDIAWQETDSGWLFLGSGFFLAYSRLSDSATFFATPERLDAVLTYNYPFLDLLIKLLQPQGYVALHAAVIGANNQFVLIPGKQNTGKSTTSATWVLHGGQLVTDDFCFVQANNPTLSYGFYPTLRLREQALPLLNRHLPPNQLQQKGDSKYFYSLLAHSPQSFVHRAQLRAIFCLDIQKQVLSHKFTGPKTAFIYLASSVAFSVQYRADSSLCLLALKKLVRALPVLHVTLSPNDDENFDYLNELIARY